MPETPTRTHRAVAALRVAPLILILSACGGDPAPPAEPVPAASADVESAEPVIVDREAELVASFARQVGVADGVDDLSRDGTELTFVGPGDTGERASWRVVIDRASIEYQGDGTTPYRGIVASSWYQDGTLVEPSADAPTLPEAFLEVGLSQDCWAIWDTTRQEWGWL